MFDNFIIRRLVKSKFPGLSDADLNKLFAVIKENPDLFKRMAEQLESLTKNGMPQEAAIQKIMSESAPELKNVFSKST